MASEHYQRHLLLRALGAWRSEVRAAAARRRWTEEQEGHRRKMEALLRLAAMKAESLVPEVPSQSQHVSRDSRKVKRTSMVDKDGTRPHPSTPEPAVWQVAKQQLVCTSCQSCHVSHVTYITVIRFSFIVK